MVDIDKWQEIFASLSRHKLRTVLTAFGVFWGIFMLVLLLGAGQGLQNGAEYEFRDDATNSLWIYPRQTSLPYKGMSKGRSIEFDNSDYDLIKNQIAGVEYITGRFYLSSESERITYKNQNYNFSVRSVHPDHVILENTILKTGRYINQLDLNEFRKSAVIGRVIKKEIFGDENPVGEWLEIGGISFKIVGTYEDTGHEDEERVVYIPITTAQKVFSTTDEINQIMVTTGNASVKEALAIEANILDKLSQKHFFSPNDPQAVRVRNRVERFESIMQLFTMINLFIWIVGVGSIIAGVIGVSNIMLIVVKDRTKEIGIRKALGATPVSIVTMILQESIFLTGLAGYLGMALGIGLVELVRSTMETYEVDAGFFRNPEVDGTMVIVATIVVVLAGAIAGLIPALRAARVNPIVAMRD
ncbi:MAG: ABC transporter permease [Aureispira sp.]|nr:ABC transporter permease [Aureispira sp.]